MRNKKKKKYHGWRNASILFGVIFTAIGLMATAFFGPRDEGLTAISLLFSILSLLIGVALYLIYVSKIKGSAEGSKLSFTALGLELAGPILWLICWIVEPVMALLLLLPIIVLPIIGMVTGVQALSEARKNNHKLGKWIAILSIFLPIVVVLYSIVMFSTGVWVIRFM